MRKAERIQGSGFRVRQGSGKPGWLAVLLMALLAAGCAAPKAQFTDADWVSHVTTGRGAYERGDYPRGADAYGRAQERARALDDADALAVAAVNRAVCLLADGRAQEALDAVREAQADGRVAKDRQAELQVVGARAALALGKPDEAMAFLAVVLKSNPPELLRAQALLTEGAVHLAGNDPAAATQALFSGLSEKAWAGLPASLRAEQAELLGRIATAQDRSGDAVARWDEASQLWKKAGRLAEMARALAEAGRQAKAAGKLPEACDRFYRAARSLWAQGLGPEAVRTLEEGVNCSEDVQDEVVGRRMAELVVTFKNEQRLSE